MKYRQFLLLTCAIKKKIKKKAFRGCNSNGILREGRNLYKVRGTYNRLILTQIQKMLDINETL